MFPLILVTNGQILMKWQQLFEIQDGFDHHLEYSKLCISDVIDMFQIEVPMFSQILVTIGKIVKQWQQFSKSKMAAAAILNYGYVNFFTLLMYSKSK